MKKYKLTEEQMNNLLQSFPLPEVGKHHFYCGCGRSFEFDSWAELKEGQRKHWDDECPNYERIKRESVL